MTKIDYEYLRQIGGRPYSYRRGPVPKDYEPKHVAVEDCYPDVRITDVESVTVPRGKVMTVKEIMDYFDAANKYQAEIHKHIKE